MYTTPTTIVKQPAPQYQQQNLTMAQDSNNIHSMTPRRGPPQTPLTSVDYYHLQREYELNMCELALAQRETAFAQKELSQREAALAQKEANSIQNQSQFQTMMGQPHMTVTKTPIPTLQLEQWSINNFQQQPNNICLLGNDAGQSTQQQYLSNSAGTTMSDIGIALHNKAEQLMNTKKQIQHCADELAHKRIQFDADLAHKRAESDADLARKRIEFDSYVHFEKDKIEARKNAIQVKEEEMKAREDLIKVREEEQKAKEDEIKSKEDEINVKENAINVKEDAIKAKENSISTITALLPRLAPDMFKHTEITRLLGQSIHNPVAMAKLKAVVDFKMDVDGAKKMVAVPDDQFSTHYDLILACNNNSKHYGAMDSMVDIEFRCEQLSKQIHIRSTHYCDLLRFIFHTGDRKHINPHKTDMMQNAGTFTGYWWKSDYESGKIPKFTPQLKLFFKTANIANNTWIQFHGPGTVLYDIDPGFKLTLGSLCDPNGKGSFTSINTQDKESDPDDKYNGKPNRSQYQISFKWE